MKWHRDKDYRESQNTYSLHREAQFTDEQLVERSLAGADESTNELLKRCHGRVYRAGRRCRLSEEDAKDIAQKVSSKVYEELKNFRRQSSFNSWIYPMVTHAISDFLKEKKKSEHIQLVDIDNVESEICDLSVMTRRYVDASNQGDRKIRECLNGLEKGQSELLLRLYEENEKEKKTTLTEIAKESNRAVGTVRDQRDRAIERLRKLLIEKGRFKESCLQTKKKKK